MHTTNLRKVGGSVMLIFASLMIAMINHQTHIDISSARLKRQWVAGPIPVPFTKELLDTDFSRFVAESRGADDARSPV